MTGTARSAAESGAGEIRCAGRVLVPGEAEGRVLLLRAPVSLWGGVDPASGRISDPRHPDCGVEVAGRVLAVPDTVGSSSSSAVMLELLREGTTPVALLLGRADAIVALGVLVAGELGYATIPVLEVPGEQLARLAERRVTVARDGTVLGR